MKIHSRLWLGVLGVLGVFLLLPDVALAQELGTADRVAEGLMVSLIDAGNGWADTLRAYARRLFFLLLGIAFIWQFWPHVFKPDFNGFMADLIRFILVYGFFFLLMDQSTVWANAIVDSFRQAGGAAAGSDGSLSPGDVFRLAIQLSNQVDNSRSIWPSVSDVFISMAALLIVVSFGFIGVLMFVALVEAIIVINAAVIFTGFGGSPWTRDYALVALRYAVAVGAKLFTLTLIVAVVMNTAGGWFGAYGGSKPDTLSMILLALLCAYMCKTIPELIAGLISGVSPGGGGAIGAMGAMGLAVASGGMGALAGAAAGVAGGGAANQATGGLTGLANNISSSLAGGRPGAGGGEPTPPKPPMPPSGGSPSGVGSMGGAMSRLASGASSSGTGATSSRIGSSIQGQSPSPGSSSQTVAMPSAPGEASATMESPASGGISEADNAQFSDVEELQADTSSDAETPDAVPPAPDDVQHSAGDTLLGKAAAIGQAGLKGAGILSALTVPGMDTAAAVPGGLPPSSPTDSSGASPEHGDKAFDAENSAHKGESSAVENVIHPASQGLPEQGRSSPSLESLRVRGMASTPPAPSPEPKDPTPKGDA